MSIDFNTFQARVGIGVNTDLDTCIAELHSSTLLLQSAYVRDIRNPDLGEFRPDFEDWLAQQLGEVLRAVANVSTAMGNPLENIAMRNVTYEP